MQVYIKKILGSGRPLDLASRTATIIISYVEMDGLIKIVKSLEQSGLLLKGVTEAVQNELKEQKGGFLSMLLDILGASFLGNILSGKGTNRAGEGVIIAGYGNKKNF